MSRILVAGGAGYAGSHACLHLAEAGHEPVVFDNFSTGWREAVQFGPMIEGDLANPEDLAAAFAQVRPDGVMHFAARSLVAESMEMPEVYWRANVTGTLNLMEAAVKAGVGAVVFSSSAAVYGETSLALIGEDAPVVPSNPYGSSKLAAEALIRDVCRRYGIACGVFRYFNIAGADEQARIGEWHRPETHLIPLVVQVALGQRQEICVYGADYPTPDGTCVRDYLHVTDLAQAHVIGMDRLLAGKGDFTLNLGSGRGWSVREVIDHVRQVTGHPVPERLNGRRAGDPARLVCDGARACGVLDWQPQHAELARMIADAWRWAQTSGFSR